jgi:hypothetical protein
MGRDDQIKPEDIVSAALLGGTPVPALGGSLRAPTPGGLALPPRMTPQATADSAPRIVAPTPEMIAALAGLRNIELLPQPTQAPWGTPMGEWTKDENQSPERPDTDSGWGRPETLTANTGSQELARVVLGKSEDMLVSIDTIVAPGTATLASAALLPLVVWAKVTFGNGSTSVQRMVQCADRFDVPVCGTFCQVSAYIGDLTGKPVNTQSFSPALPIPSAQVSVMISRGIRGTPYIATIFQAQSGVVGQFVGPSGAVGPLRLSSVAAHLQGPGAAGAQRFLMLFDSQAKPASGTSIPTVEYGLGTLPSPGVPFTPYINTRAFSQSCWWAVSTTSAVLNTAAEPIWIEAETMQI